MKITIKEASQLIKMSEDAIRQWIKEDKIKSYKEENIIKVNKRQVLEQVAVINTIFNRKGGVGKTSTTIILGDYYEKKGKKVLLVDLDPQYNLTETFLEEDEIFNRPTFFDFMKNNTSLDKIVYKISDNMDLIPAIDDMDDMISVDSDFWFSKEKDLMTFFRKYDIVLLDCPPSVNAYSRLALFISNYIFIPVVPGYYSSKGILKVIKKVDDYIKRMNKNCQGYKVYISANRKRKTNIRKAFTEYYEGIISQDKFLQSKIPEFVGIEERPALKGNIFDLFKEKKYEEKINEIKEFCDEFDKILYEERMPL